MNREKGRKSQNLGRTGSPFRRCNLSTLRSKLFEEVYEKNKFATEEEKTEKVDNGDRDTGEGTEIVKIMHLQLA